MYKKSPCGNLPKGRNCKFRGTTLDFCIRLKHEQTLLQTDNGVYTVRTYLNPVQPRHSKGNFTCSDCEKRFQPRRFFSGRCTLSSYFLYHCVYLCIVTFLSAVCKSFLFLTACKLQKFLPSCCVKALNKEGVLIFA